MEMNGEMIRKNISKNITKYREKAALSQKELANRLHVTPSRVSNWEQGANCPTIEILFDVCKVLGTSINEIYGVYPSTDFSLSFLEIEHIKKYRVLDLHGKDMVDIVLDREYTHSISIKEAAEDNDDRQTIIASIPYAYDLAASAGLGEYAMDIAHFETVGLSETPPRGADFLIRIDGDSMEPKYSHNDKVYIKRQDAVNEGEIGLFYLDGNVYIKKQGYDKLISLNPDYDPVPVAEDATSKCFGKVLGKCQSNIIEL